MSKEVYFYGTLVTPAQINGPESDVFTSNILLFSKPRWVPDEDTFICYHCASKFTPIRRKHHCRQCGRVFCSQCCNLKMQLKHLSYTSPERVCILCKHFVTLLFKAQSTDRRQKLEALVGLGDFCQDTRTIIPFIEMGGVLALIFVAKERDLTITDAFLKAMNSLALHPTLHTYLAVTGTIKILTKILMDMDRNHHALLCDVINVIRSLSSSESVKLLALQEGAVDALVPYCNSNMGPLCLPALECLSIICDHPLVYNAIVSNKQTHTLAKLLILTNSDDAKVQDVTLQILAQISNGSEWHRQRLVEEDVYNGSLLADVLASRPTNTHVLRNAACLVANLAIDENAQGALLNHLQQMCRMLELVQNETEVMRHVARGLANFAKFRNNCEILLGSLTNVVIKLMQSPDEQIRHHACQVIVALLGYCTSSCVQVLQRVDSTYFLEYLGYNGDLITAIHRILSGKLPMVAWPGAPN